MALHFSVSAPGKVILNGEHSVVYGKPALAGVIGLRNTLTLEANSKTQLTFHFDLAIDSFIVEVEVYNAFLRRMGESWSGITLPDDIDHDRFLGEIQAFVDGQCTGEHEERFHQARYAAFYLLTGALLSAKCDQLVYGFQLELKSGLTMGAGLGSSASFGVCLATAFYFYSNYRIRPNCIRHYNDEADDAEKSIIQTTISNWAFCSERLMHGNPSGLDNTICTVGQMLKFYKGVAPIGVRLRVPLNVVLVNTAVGRSTLTLVQKVATLRAQHIQLVDHILNAMGTLVEDVISILESATADDHEYFPRIERLVRINNNLLRSLGVSHPRLERVFDISEAHGFASKLTGAGGGGYAIVLLPPGYEETVEFGRLGKALTADGLEWQATTIGGAGVQIVEHTE